VTGEILDQLAHKDRKVRWVQEEIKDLLVLAMYRVRKGHEDSQALQDQQVHKDLRVLRVLLDYKDRKV
jgi:hypothetical protein